MKRDRMVVFVILLLSFGLYWLPSQFTPEDDGYIRAKGAVLSVDNEHVYARGVVRTGVQEVVLQIADGPYEGKTITCSNTLLGKLEMDKIFAPGDTAPGQGPGHEEHRLQKPRRSDRTRSPDHGA